MLYKQVLYPSLKIDDVVIAKGQVAELDPKKADNLIKSGALIAIEVKKAPVKTEDKKDSKKAK
ncbi:hypothetical protein [Francisella marina]|uniref:Uncharacterized protein n=1 Tax=Francisella marina TaxID=2249302 RepID=A0ABX5ZHR7_9GAMM|nr:hypothetical protein [Francisella marina]QEO57567.1 hypothetical protein F0R74_06765 [Francisella marina]